MIKRTHACGEITKNDIGKNVSLNGWIAKTRDLGGLIFIDLEITLLKLRLFLMRVLIKYFDKAKKLGLEDVIGVEGKVIQKADDAINQNMVTGYIDVDVSSLIVYNESGKPLHLI